MTAQNSLSICLTKPMRIVDRIHNRSLGSSTVFSAWICTSIQNCTRSITAARGGIPKTPATFADHAVRHGVRPFTHRSSFHYLATGPHSPTCEAIL